MYIEDLLFDNAGDNVTLTLYNVTLTSQSLALLETPNTGFVFGVSNKARPKPAESKFRYDTSQQAKNKGADRTAQMRRLVCAFVVRNPPKRGFLSPRLF